MTTQVRLAVRDWDYLTPMLLNEIDLGDLDIQLTRVNTLVDDWASHPQFDGGEMSLSRYSQMIAKGEKKVIGAPHFLMRGFRHRCIIVKKESPLTTIEDLAGKRIGLTGWQDSGNTWTRAIFRHHNLNLTDVHWFVGRLTAQHPIVDRLNGFGAPGHIDACPNEQPMMDMLDEGTLDAVCTPFMPSGFFSEQSAYRQLLPHFVEDETEYFHQRGYVPGIHILILKPEFHQAHPQIAQKISAAFDRSYQVWMEKRAKYADTTPWILAEIARTHQTLPADWNNNGIAANQQMLQDWCDELKAQEIIKRELTIDALFPDEQW